MLAFLRSLTPNRIAVYLGAFVALATMLSPLLVEYNLEQVAAVVAGLAAFAAVLVKFLSGWQQYERAIYEAEQIKHAHAAQLERQAQATAPRGSKLNLPR